MSTGERRSPRQTLGEIAAVSESGRIEVEHARSADVRTTSGRVEVGRVDERCRARTVSGRLTVEACAGADLPLSIRQGLHYGEALTRGDDVIGHTVNVAARVVDLAAPGEILVSADAVAACDHLTDRATLQPIGPAAVKGVREPIWLHRLSA